MADCASGLVQKKGGQSGNKVDGQTADYTAGFHCHAIKNINCSHLLKFNKWP